LVKSLAIAGNLPEENILTYDKVKEAFNFLLSKDFRHFIMEDEYFIDLGLRTKINGHRLWLWLSCTWDRSDKVGESCFADEFERPDYHEMPQKVLELKRIYDV
jgi:hypothetical protein